MTTFERILYVLSLGIAPTFCVAWALMSDLPTMGRLSVVAAWLATVAWGIASLRWQHVARQRAQYADIIVHVPPVTGLDEREVVNRVADLLRQERLHE